jgi:hypothetical protein
LIEAQSVSSIFSVFGGKNSNETAISPAPSSLLFLSPSGAISASSPVGVFARLPFPC